MGPFREAGPLSSRDASRKGASLRPFEGQRMAKLSEALTNRLLMPGALNNRYPKNPCTGNHLYSSSCHTVNQHAFSRTRLPRPT